MKNRHGIVREQLNGRRGVLVSLRFFALLRMTNMDRAKRIALDKVPLICRADAASSPHQGEGCIAGVRNCGIGDRELSRR